MYLAGTLVLAVTDEFDNAAFIWCKTWRYLVSLYPGRFHVAEGERKVSLSKTTPTGMGVLTADLSHDLTAECSALAKMSLCLFVHQSFVLLLHVVSSLRTLETFGFGW